MIEGRFQRLYDEAKERVAAWAAGADRIEYRPSPAWTLEWIDREWMKD